MPLRLSGRQELCCDRTPLSLLIIDREHIEINEVASHAEEDVENIADHHHQSWYFPLSEER